ncbi:hypothetical protein WG66_008832 [Moniliophthora roreri]|nr:hypothetical protein WG66_008832 [Moniliophthora roreri]
MPNFLWSPFLEAPGRLRRTHVSDDVTRLLRSLRIVEKLRFNKNIEKQDQDRKIRRENHAMDPTRPSGSLTASEVTIATEEIRKSKGLFEQFKTSIPLDWLKWMELMPGLGTWIPRRFGGNMGATEEKAHSTEFGRKCAARQR